MTVSVTVVIATIGRPELQAQLDALACQETDLPWELVLVVDGDLGATTVPAGIPSVREIDVTGLHSAPGSKNTGIAAAAGEVVLLCDDDDVVEPGWIQAMIDGLGDADLVAGPVDGVTLNPPPVRWWRSRIEGDDLHPLHDFLPAGLGCNLGGRADVLRSIDGFTWDGTSDDIDLCWRAQLAGYRLAWAPGAVVQYRYRADLRGHLRQQYTYGRGTARLLRSYGGEHLRPAFVEAMASILRILPQPRLYAGRRFTLGGWLGYVVHSAGLFRGAVDRKDGHRAGFGISHLVDPIRSTSP